MRKIIPIFLTTFVLSFIVSGAQAVELPKILSESDATIYKEIFRLQAAEKISAAIEIEKSLKDPILKCEVLYQRYTSKTYRSKGKELAAWMQKCYNKPGAERIAKIAKIKKASVRSPKLPTPDVRFKDIGAKSESWTTKEYSGATAGKIKQFKKVLSRGSTKNARHILEDKKFVKSLSKADYGRLAGRLAFIYYTNGEIELAKKFGQISANEKSEYGLWTMGLIAFKEGKFDEAEAKFNEMTNLTQLNDARKIEALFWAGRSAEMAGNNGIAKKHWRIGMKRPQLFYGTLSAAMLDKTPEYEFFDKGISDDDIEQIINTGYGKTALAFLQIDDKVRAEKYLALLATKNASDKMLHALYSLSSTEKLPRMSMQMAGLVRNRGIMEIDQNVIFGAQYPLPDWEPMGGWSIDRALLFAITRQESGFKTSAKSVKGAKGVMQMMPKTAKMVAKRNNVHISKLDISKPEHNMFLGQQYIVDLLNLPLIDKNIIKMLAAYNSGEGSVMKFEKRFQTDDPLLWIESFPHVETRNYIKRVISNLWLYRAKLDQPLTGLEELADGKWPMYSSEDEFVKSQITDKTI
ncbi:MAG: lytic transglycosylase domain-containing protein [Alphaproteobacteria bacterium]|jgi:soluble lytic murein transglycosylase|nr:lytic transglycosylase domain-containing protein [Alphaproteobacteria bacterium]